MIYSWGHSKRYNDFSTHIKSVYSERIQKVSIDAGFTCPNRDGSKGVGGCTFCNNNTFNPAYCVPTKSIASQIDQGVAFFAPKYKTQKYLAYFQAYSNTYSEIVDLKQKYQEALAKPEVVGLVIGTRPDCVSEELLDYFAELKNHTDLTIEYGIESTIDRTLELINRGHTYQESVDAILKTANRGITVGGHLILGLPGESYGDILSHAGEISKLPLNYLKLHQLQIVKGSQLGRDYMSGKYTGKLFTLDEYINLVIDFLELLSPKIIMERFISQSPGDLLIAPKWGVKNFEFVAKVERRLVERDTYQGRLYVEAL